MLVPDGGGAKLDMLIHCGSHEARRHGTVPFRIAVIGTILKHVHADSGTRTLAGSAEGIRRCVSFRLPVYQCREERTGDFNLIGSASGRLNAPVKCPNLTTFLTAALWQSVERHCPPNCVPVEPDEPGWSAEDLKHIDLCCARFPTSQPTWGCLSLTIVDHGALTPREKRSDELCTRPHMRQTLGDLIETSTKVQEQ
jgi:hypothetical protein